ncbi:MAG: hypothetical protein ACTHKT_02365 [Solirubrobacterales bacterium]
MNDDWRLQIDFREEGHADALLERFQAGELQHDLKNSFHDRAIVTRDGARVFVYAGDRGQAEQARTLIANLAQQHDWTLESDLSRWHPVAEEWEPVGAPLPRDLASKAAERAELMARERQQTEERGSPEFEVLIELPSHREAHELAERLVKEGLPCARRWKYVAVGTTDEDSAKRLAERIRTEAPTESKVSVAGTPQAVFADLPRSVRIADVLTGQVY